jgi:hypothetical protein
MDNTKWCCRTTLCCPQNNTWEVSNGNVKHQQDAPKDILKQHTVSPQKNFMLPQVQSHVCLWTNLTCPKFQSQNLMAWFAKGIGKLNPSPLGWFSHLHCHGASPWWSQQEAHPTWVEFAWKGTSFALYHPPKMNISIDKIDIWQSKGLNLFNITHRCEMNTT